MLTTKSRKRLKRSSRAPRLSGSKIPEIKAIASREQREEMLEFVRRLFGLIPRTANNTGFPEWAEEKCVLPGGLTARPGPFRWRITPYLREIAACLSESSTVREVAVMKGARIGYTAALIVNHICYMIDKCPGSAMLVSATKEMAQTMGELRIDPMLDYSGISGKVYSQSRKKSNKKSGDRPDKKEFAGGYLLIGGPTGPFLRGNGAKYLYLDELDEWKLQIGGADKKKSVTANQGDPLTLVRRRAAEYEGRKIIYGSTPLDDSTSKIKGLFEEGDMCQYHVPCPKCSTLQVLRWQDNSREGADRFRMKYETDKDGRLIRDSVYYECENKECRHHWKNADKDTFLELGKWIPSVRAKTPNFRSFHISSLYSPVGMQSWEDICQEWLKTKDNPSALKSFMNTILGEPWKDPGIAPIAKKIYAAREGYDAGTLPAMARVLFITIGADVQEDRIECEVVGWGRGMESWSIEYFTLPGDTADLGSEAWKEMARVIETEHAGFMPELVLIDSGFRTGVVRDFCEPYRSGVIPIKGRQNLQADKGVNRVYSLFIDPSFSKPTAHLDTTYLKLQVYSFLQRGTSTGEAPDKPFPCYCHFPRGTDDPRKGYSKEYFDHLMSEDLVSVRVAGGYTVKRWEKHGRNEPLDARAYALAGVHILYGEWAKPLIEREKAGEGVKYEWTDFWDACQ